MVGYDHELGQCRVPEDGVVWQANVADVEVDELGAVVVARPEGDREADLPNRDRGAVGNSGERLGGLKLTVGYLEIVECFHGQDVEPCPAIDEGLVTSTLLMIGEQSIRRPLAVATHLS